MRGRSVVDTNVLVAANDRDTHVNEHCQLACVDELARLAREDVVCVDDKFLILGEYGRRTGQRGQEKPGTVFYKHVWQKMRDTNRVRLIPVEPRDAEGRDFSDPVLPPNNLKKDANLPTTLRHEAGQFSEHLLPPPVRSPSLRPAALR